MPQLAARTLVGVIVSLVLMLLLALQLVLSREQLSAYPGVASVLERVCRAWSCEPVLPQRADALVIESSSFERVADNTYRLALNLRNNASVDVAWPSLELSLTDSSSAVVLRRVITAQELDLKVDMLLSGATLRITQGLTLPETWPEASRVAGYRLLAFYP